MAEPTPAQSKDLWLGFIKEWEEEAQEKGSRSAHAYHKAWKGLKNHPTQLKVPRDMIVIAGIGPTMVDKLDKCLKKWCLENGHEMPTNGES